MVRTDSYTSISAWNSGMRQAPGLQFRLGTLEWLLDFNFDLKLWNETGFWTSISAWNSAMMGSWTSISVWNSGMGRAPGLQFRLRTLE
ncbi:hypothetical protein C1646_764644 [Rhizophagus diaphanus]|nr:hypothetical protein C1646_764644 [Rhizophagus diaphanus] [Rhizophagus sp. MUCL 43196]